MQLRVYRYNPEVDEAPRMQDMDVEVPEGKDLMVLDVLELAKVQDPTLTYRRSCREGVCGSDGVNMNGKNGLACITTVSSVMRRGKLVIRPLPGLPVIRDLVVDLSQFYNQYEKVKPYLINDLRREIRARPRRLSGARRRQLALPFALYANREACG